MERLTHDGSTIPSASMSKGFYTYQPFLGSRDRRVPSVPCSPKPAAQITYCAHCAVQPVHGAGVYCVSCLAALKSRRKG